MTSSIYESDEETPGWIAERSVAYCENCFEEKMKRTERQQKEDLQEERAANCAYTSEIIDVVEEIPLNFF